MSEVTLESLTEQVAKLQRKFDDFTETAEELKHAWREFKNSNSSRRGLDGGRGETGPAGRDAVLRIVQSDGTTDVVDVNGVTVAQLVSIAGPAGKDGVTGAKGDRGDTGLQGRPGFGVDGKDGEPGKTGPAGRDGKDALSRAQIEALVVDTINRLEHHATLRKV